MEKKEQIQVSFRIPKTLKDLIDRYLIMDLHLNASAFFRDALREKIQKDAPGLYSSLFEKEAV